MLYWNTVNDQLKESLLLLMDAELFTNFRLVGGTALSLHLGHRMSVDIDLFTDAPYGSVDFEAIDRFLQAHFSYIDTDFGLFPGMGKSYVIGKKKDEAVKLDVFYTTDPFMQPATETQSIRLATIEEIIAMKIDVVQRGGRKKDFWDLHELLPTYDLDTMIALHRKRYEYTHNEPLILQNLTAFEKADDDFDPICLQNKYWEFIKEDFEEALEKRNRNR